MGLFSRNPERSDKAPVVVIPEYDQLDALRHNWLGRVLQAGGDERGAALCFTYADLVNAYNEAKWTARAHPDNADWAHRKQMLLDQLRAERVFWRNLQPDELVVISNEPEGFWPTDAELLAGA